MIKSSSTVYDDRAGGRPQYLLEDVMIIRRNPQSPLGAAPAVLYGPDRNRSASTAPRPSRRVLALALSAIAFGSLAAGTTPRVYAQAVSLLRVDVSHVAKGYRASKLINANVSNDKNEKIGTLDDIIIDQTQKNALFAVLQVGGFLGLGGRLVAVPYESLQISEDGKKIVLPAATKDELKKLSEFKYET
jgi:sporulation protein YlmC with PRC-barrel domain